MDKLLQHYEQEIDRLRRAARQYAETHPLTPDALAPGADESTDHEAERLLQSAAMLNASMQECIEANQCEFRQALLQSLQRD